MTSGKGVVTMAHGLPRASGVCSSSSTWAVHIIVTVPDRSR